MTHETLMSKNVKIFQGPTDRRTDRRTDRPTDMTSPRSSYPELKKCDRLLGDNWRPVSNIVLISKLDEAAL